uniref:PH domain-containing protein n=1 Tax=Hydatigena taeniaeformis TaxID=6205 RepID=A0A0R3WHZ3_HYDTA
LALDFLLGGVDLNSCDCIYEQKACNRWPNVFVVKTTHRGKRRDYLFSANSLEEMNDWISQLTKALHMVPDRTPGSPLKLRVPFIELFCFLDVVGRNSSNLSYLGSRRPVIPTTTKVSNFALNSNQFKGSRGYLERGFTEEYRTSFGEATADDEDCYHVLPQPDHAYVNLKGDGSVVIEDNLQNDQGPPRGDNGPRPDSVYFNVWDSPTVDVNDGNRDQSAYHVDLSESEQPDREALGAVEDKEAKARCQLHTKEALRSGHENFSKTQLPKRSRTRTTSSSSSAVSFDDGDGNESDAGGSKNAGALKTLSGVVEAEAAASSLEEGACVKAGNTSGPAADTGGSAIHYLDAENLDFSLRQRSGHGVANAVPIVPPKPVHLRRMTPAEATTEVSASNDVTSSGYNELDPRSTQAFFMVTKRVFGDANEA